MDNSRRKERFWEKEKRNKEGGEWLEKGDREINNNIDGRNNKWRDGKN